jgi:hypothetical protein
MYTITAPALNNVLTSLPQQPVYNASQPSGGNPLEVNVNAQYAGVEFK